jgi:D-glycerate 3-kinase
MKSCNSKSKSTLIPFYDKSLKNGNGDRANPSEFKKVSGPIDLVLLEGWMLGFQSARL